MHSCFLLFFTIFTFSSAEACFNQIINNESYDVSPYCGGDMSFAAEFKPTFDFHHVEAQLQYLIGSTWVTYTSYVTNEAQSYGPPRYGACYSVPLSFIKIPAFYGMSTQWRIRGRIGTMSGGTFTPSSGVWVTSSVMHLWEYKPISFIHFFLNDPQLPHNPFIANNCTPSAFNLSPDFFAFDLSGQALMTFTIYSSNSNGDKVGVLEQHVIFEEWGYWANGVDRPDQILDFFNHNADGIIQGYIAGTQGFIIVEVTFEQCDDALISEEIWIQINETPQIASFYLETAEVNPITNTIVPNSFINVPVSTDINNVPVIGGITGRLIGNVSTPNYDYWRLEIYQQDVGNPGNFNLINPSGATNTFFNPLDPTTHVNQEFAITAIADDANDIAAANLGVTYKCILVLGTNGCPESEFYTYFQVQVFHHRFEPYIDIISAYNESQQTIHLRINDETLTLLNDDLYIGKIYDLNGRLLAQKVISQNEALISTSRFAPATYLVVLEDKNGSVLYRNKFFKSN